MNHPLRVLARIGIAAIAIVPLVVVTSTAAEASGKGPTLCIRLDTPEAFSVLTWRQPTGRNAVHLTGKPDQSTCARTGTGAEDWLAADFWFRGALADEWTVDAQMIDGIDIAYSILGRPQSGHDSMNVMSWFDHVGQSREYTWKNYTAKITWTSGPPKTAHLDFTLTHK